MDCHRGSDDGLHRRLVSQLQAQLISDSVRILDVDMPDLTLNLNMHMAIGIRHTGCTDLLDASLKTGLNGATGFVVVCESIDLQDAAEPSNGNIPFLTSRIDQLALPSRP